MQVMNGHLKAYIFWNSKKPDSTYYKVMHISHPNEADKASAEKLGVSPGGNIMNRGQRNGFGG